MTKTKKTQKLTPVKDLSAQAIDMVPRSFDYSEGYESDSETSGWTYREPVACEKCGEALISFGGDRHSDLDPETECAGHVPSAEGPMMSYFYELPGDVEEDQLFEIVHLPLCLVDLNGSNEKGLALTGGGMDLSWEICEGFMRLGYLPPTHFRLPAMSGRGENKRDRWIMAGMRRALSVQQIRLNAKKRELRSLTK